MITPTLVRAEYAVDNAFTDAGTFTAISRPLATSGFSTSVANGELTVQTSAMTIRYQEGSGRFAAANLSVTLASDPDSTPQYPQFGNEICNVGATCEAENSVLGGGTVGASNHVNYTGAGFVAGPPGNGTMTWTVEGATPGSYSLQVRYANASGQDSAVRFSATMGASGSIALPVVEEPDDAGEADWDTWAVAAAPITVANASFTLTLTCGDASGCPVNIDSIALTVSDAPYPTGIVHDFLGGWLRNLDETTGPVPLRAGLLSSDGWSLLDDSKTATWDGTHMPAARTKADVDHQDGYIFGYGTDYAQALSDFITLTGPPPLLPRYAFGVIFSEWYPYYAADWENTIIPAFASNDTPLDMIGVDTDWKAPSSWDGWEWSPTYFPDPSGFAQWAQGKNLHVLLNIHPSIQNYDPEYSGIVVPDAGQLQTDGAGSTQMVFDLGQAGDVAAFGALHKSMIDYGMVMWLDWCCDDVNVSVPGLMPDSWFNEIYAGLPAADGHRGFSWARVGSQLGGGNVVGNDPLASPGTGPWADHRSTVQFTGDTYPDWGTLQFEVEFTAAETSIGLAYVSHDIGSFHQCALSCQDSTGACATGPGCPAAGYDPDDLYARWVQFGAFQPALRLHSDHGYRLPWEYGVEAQTSAETFLRLREAMLPYNYTLGWQAHTTGVSMARPLWFAYPTESEAYNQPGEYMWGDELLVAPVTVGGTPVTTQVWFPPGAWVAFSDAGLAPQVYQGPGTYSVTTTLTSMPVFAKAGSIVPMQSYTSNATVAADTFEPRVVGGADGQYTLYEDEGEGFGYQSGQSATTLMTLSGSTFTIAKTKGTYPNAPSSRAYEILWSNVAAPNSVLVNGVMLAPDDAGTGDSGTSKDAGPPDRWTYDPVESSLLIWISARPTGAPVVVQLM